MTELTKATSLNPIKSIAEELIQLAHIKGESVFITDPEGGRIEIKTTQNGKIVLTNDEKGNAVAIEERLDGTVLYHVAMDSAGLPSSHEIRPDSTQIIYFYGSKGTLQHFVELKSNGDRISTILGKDNTMYSMEQKQVGGIMFKAWVTNENEVKEGLVWLQHDGSVSTFGDKAVINDLYAKFAKFLDGVQV